MVATLWYHWYFARVRVVNLLWKLAPALSLPPIRIWFVVTIHVIANLLELDVLEISIITALVAGMGRFIQNATVICAPVMAAARASGMENHEP